MKLRFLILGLTLLGVAGGIGCGSTTEPISVLGDPNAVPSLQNPVPASMVLLNTNPITPYSTTNEGIDYIPIVIGATTTSTFQVSAPISGLVTKVDDQLNAGYVAVTIFQSARYQVRVSKMTSSSVRVGDQIASGSLLGVGTAPPQASSGTSVLQLALFVNGVATCPYSYMDASAKAFLNTYLNLTGITVNNRVPCTN